MWWLFLLSPEGTESWEEEKEEEPRTATSSPLLTATPSPHEPVGGKHNCDGGVSGWLRAGRDP